jgi:hypothetical protein
MADDGSTTRQTTTDDESGVHRLRDIVVEEVSLVDRAANKRRFLLVKRSNQMADEGKPKRASAPGAGGKKPRPKLDEDVDKTRPRVMHAASEEDDDEEETEKSRRSREFEDDDDDEETEKVRRPTESEDDDEAEKARRSTESADDEDEETEKADDEDEESEDDDEEETEKADDEEDDSELKPGKGRPPAKPPVRARARAKGRPGSTDERTRKAEENALVLPASAKNAVLRALAQALERLMAVANQVKEADASDDQSEARVPDELTGALEDICELLEDVGDQLAEPAEKARNKKPDTASGRSTKADVNKAGRRMAKDRLERFQKALELLAAVLKELTDEKPVPTPSAGSAEKPLGKRESPDVSQLVASVQELTRVVKRQEEQLIRLQKTRATSNAIPVEGTSRRREIQEVSWPLDMNRPITRDRVDKAISFYDEE